MNDLLTLQAFLSNAHLTDPRLALANAVAWLNPMSLFRIKLMTTTKTRGILNVRYVSAGLVSRMSSLAHLSFCCKVQLTSS